MNTLKYKMDMLSYMQELVNLREEYFDEYKKHNRELRYSDKKLDDTMLKVLDKEQYDIFRNNFEKIKQNRMLYNMLQLHNVRKMVKVLRIIEKRRW